MAVMHTLDYNMHVSSNTRVELSNMRTTPSFDPRMSLQPPSMLYLSSTTIFLGLAFVSSGAFSSFWLGLVVACGGGLGFGFTPKAGELKSVPDHSEIAATHGAKW